MSVLRLVPKYPEPVPGASQFAVLPFLAAVEGYLRGRSSGMAHGGGPRDLRVVLHRVMSRNGQGYLQQASAYVGERTYDPTRAGRIYPVTDGIMGRAYKSRKVQRTRPFPSEADLLEALATDMAAQGDTTPMADVGKSYLAIPLLGPDGSPVAILFGDSKQYGLFADDSIIQDVVAMCHGFCRILDELATRPVSGIRNYPLEPGVPVEAQETVFATLQAEFETDAPRFTQVNSLNFEASN